MSIIVEVIPDPDPRQLAGESHDPASTPETELAKKLQSAYQQHFVLYERALATAINLLDLLSPRLAPSQFPRVDVIFDGVEEEVVFDFGLYERLLELYVFEGWAGILQVESELDKHLPPAEVDPPSGGMQGKATLWLQVGDFFHFTRNLLVLLIRETLVQIERKAANVIETNLSLSAQQIAKAWNDFVEDDTIYGNSAPRPEGNYKNFYRLKDEHRSLSDALCIALSQAVQQKFAYEDTLKRVARVRDAITITRWRLEGRQRFQPDKKRRLKEELRRLELSEVELQQLATRSEEFLKSMLEVIHVNYPLGLLVLDGLERDFKKEDKEDMEHKLGMAIGELNRKLDEIRQGVDPGLSRTNVEIRTPVCGEYVPWEVLQAWKPPRECLARGIERFIVNRALDRLAVDSGWFSLAHEATWHGLVESGAISKDSFEYVVYVHYVFALMDEIEIRRESEQSSKEFWKAFGKFAAALSLLSLVTPGTAVFAPVLRGASGAADLILLGYMVHSVVDNLARLDQLLATELVQPDAFALEDLSRVGELIHIRREALEHIPAQIALELTVVSASKIFPLVKKLVLLRGYYFDLETLLDDGEEN